MRHFRLSFAFTSIALAAAFAWGLSSGFGGQQGVAAAGSAVLLALILGVMEVSLSFDNAIVNAAYLERLTPVWQRRFLTWGMLIAVFGMRLVFPIVIVAAAARLGLGEVLSMAIQEPLRYAEHLHAAHPVIAAFGGVFLLLVFLNFVFDPDKDAHWLVPLEERLVRVGRLPAAGPIVTLGVLLLMQGWLPEASRQPVLFAGVLGVVLYTLVDGLGELLGGDGADAARRAGIAGFLYLEFLDASFSFDGVIGAFAITREVVLITLGLAIGAMFVRSMTLYLVDRGTLQAFTYLEHGAHYAVGVLAVLMLAGTVPGWQAPEVVTGLVGVAFVLAALWSSRRQQPVGLVGAD